MVITDFYSILNRQITYKTDNKFNRNTLKLNILLHKVLNLHIFPPRNISSTNSNISSDTFNNFCTFWTNDGTSGRYT